MKGLLFLLCCTEILAALLCGAQDLPESLVADSGNVTDRDDSAVTSVTALPTASSSTSRQREASSSMSPPSPPPFPSSPRVSPSPSPFPSPSADRQPPTSPNGMLYLKECLPMLMVSGGLLIACSILLVSTLLLAWKVCQLSRRVRALGSNADLGSNSDLWMGTAKGDKGKSEAEPKETSVLMADLGKSQEETGNGTAADKEAGAAKEAEGEAANGAEASTTPAAEDSPPSSKPQEEAAESQPKEDGAAPTSEPTEQPECVV